jgi:polyisoprenoid-binding protein YceI
MATWGLDPVHSSVQFSARHMMVTNVRGQFRDFAVDVDFDPQHPEQGHVRATIQAASIDTGMEQRDQHLRSADFLDVATHPTLAFSSTGISRSGDDRFHIQGDLTIRGETRPVVLDVEYLGVAKNLQGGTSAGFTARTKISRKDWGLTWNVGLESGGWLVSDDVRIEIDLELLSAAVAQPVSKVESDAA